MKILLSYFLTVILVSIFYGRFLNIVTASESEKTIIDLNQNKATVGESNEEELVLIESSTLEINTVFSKETERQEVLLPSQLVVDDPAFLDEIEVSAELSTTAEAAVFPSVDTAAELKNKVKTQFYHEKVNSSNQIFNSLDNENKEYIVHAEPKMQVQTIIEEIVNKEVNESESLSTSSEEDPKKTAPQHEDIPSFSEWTQKQLAEAEKKRTDQNETTDKFTKPRGKFRNKNYASPDCGAKIVAANPESLSSSSVLSSLKDEYMLNYCANRIWFVVELCEAIQAKQLDLANFELFSSSPKHFSVSISHRFPTRDWSNVGKFTAQDSRDVQTFNLHPHLFGKYVKVELHSHYGREQFCPISWVGIYGTSEYEVLAKEDERHLLPEDDDGDSYDEEIFVGNKRDSPKNLFSSATDAVLSIVKKATAPFMKADNNETESQSSINVKVSSYTPCFSPRYITVCNNCSQSFYDEVFSLLSCQHLNLVQLISSSFVKRTLINSESCNKFGLDFNSLRAGAPFPSNFLKNPGLEVNYVTVMLKNSIIGALCNVLAVSENKVVINATTVSVPTLANLTQNKDLCEEDVNHLKSQLSSSVNPSSACGSDCSQSLQYHYTKTSVFTEIFKPSELFSEKIEPTKTLTEDEVKMLPPSDVYSESIQRVMEEKSTELPSKGPVSPTATHTIKRDRVEVENSIKKKDSKVSSTETKDEGEKEMEAEDKSNNATNQDSTLESIISDINAIEKVVNSPLSSVTPSASNLPTETIFLRLANRIKNLEINMSLSSTYLEELSKRYRTQLELLSKTLNLTIQKVEEYSKSDEEKERMREKEIMLIRIQLANLTRDVSLLVKEKNSWRPRASSISQLMFFISVEILVIWMAFKYWRRRPMEHKSVSNKPEPVKKLTKKSRRNSLEGVKGHETPRRKLRRPSDEALEIALSRNYNGDTLKIDKKRKRRKKDSRSSINVIHLKRKKSEGEMSEIQMEKPISDLASEETSKSEFIPNSALNTAELHLSNRFAPMASPKTPPESGNWTPKKFQGFPSPIFMKTAIAARNSRLRSALNRESSQELSISSKSMQESTCKKDTLKDKKDTLKDRKGSNSLKKYMKKFF